MRLYKLDAVSTQHWNLIEKSPLLETSATSKLFNAQIVTISQDNDIYDFIPLERLFKLNVEKKMRHVLTWAKMLSLERFNGDSNSECYICDTGGDVWKVSWFRLGMWYVFCRYRWYLYQIFPKVEVKTTISLNIADHIGRAVF